MFFNARALTINVHKSLWPILYRYEIRNEMQHGIACELQEILMNVDIFNTNNKYKIIYADPAWPFNSKKTGGSMTSGSEHQYKSVMTIEDIKALPVAELADDNCLLVMWYVSSQPQEALDVVKAWGFKLRNMNGFVWNKLTNKGNNHFGMGFYTRAGAECAIIATKGKPSDIVVDHGVRQLRSSMLGAHSEKPAEFRDDIVRLAGDVPRIELFSRHDVTGWDRWGNELLTP